MIIVKEKTIMCSRGDTFITLFYVKGLVLTENDRAVFTVKKDIEGRQTLLSLPCGIDTLNNVISVFGTAQEMRHGAGDERPGGRNLLVRPLCGYRRRGAYHPGVS